MGGHELISFYKTQDFPLLQYQSLSQCCRPWGGGGGGGGSFSVAMSVQYEASSLRFDLNSGPPYANRKANF